MTGDRPHCCFFYVSVRTHILPTLAHAGANHVVCVATTICVMRHTSTRSRSRPQTDSAWHHAHNLFFRFFQPRFTRLRHTLAKRPTNFAPLLRLLGVFRSCHMSNCRRHRTCLLLAEWLVLWLRPYPTGRHLN
jgi:hypothetical protein